MKKMKYILTGLFIVTLNKIVLTQDKLPGLIQGGQYRQGTLGNIIQPDLVRHSSDMMYSAGTYPLYTPELAQGKGRENVNIYCRFCHSVTYITMQPSLSPSTWKSEVDKMIDAYGAPIPDDAAKQITMYLQSHYTAETRK